MRQQNYFCYQFEDSKILNPKKFWRLCPTSAVPHLSDGRVGSPHEQLPEGNK